MSLIFFLNRFISHLVRYSHKTHWSLYMYNLTFIILKTGSVTQFKSKFHFLLFFKNTRKQQNKVEQW